MPRASAFKTAISGDLPSVPSLPAKPEKKLPPEGKKAWRRGEKHHENQDNRIDQHAVVVQGAEELRKQGQKHGGNDRAPHVPDPAEDHKDENHDGLIVAEVLRESLQGAQIVGIEHPRRAGDSRGDRKGKKLKARSIEADGFRGDSIVPDRRNGPAGPGIHEPEHKKKREEEQDDPDRKIRKLRGPGNPLRPLNDDPPAACKLKRSSILQGKVCTPFVHAEVEGIDQVFDDLPEGERHDREVVSLQAEHRNSDQKAEYRRRKRADHDRKEKAEPVRKPLSLHQHRKARRAEGPDAHEARVPEGELPGDPDHKIQAQRHDGIDAKGHQKSLKEGARRAASQKKLRREIGSENHGIARHIALKDLFSSTVSVHRCTLHLLRDLLPQDSAGLHKKHQDEDGKHNRIGKLGGNIGLREILQNPQNHSAEKGPGYGTDPSQHRGDKGLDSGHRPCRRCQAGIGGAKEDARHCGEGRTDRKGHRDRRIDIDAHERGCPLVLGDREHRLPRLRAVDKEEQSRRDDKSRQYRRYGLSRNRERASGKMQGLNRDKGLEALRIRAKDKEGEILQEVGDADRRDQNGEGIRPAKRLIGDPLRQNTRERTDDDGEKRRGRNRKAEAVERDKCGIGSQHKDVAVRKIQHLRDAVHHRIAECDDGIDRSQADAVQQIRKKTHHGYFPLRCTLPRPRSGAESEKKGSHLAALFSFS